MTLLFAPVPALEPAPLHLGAALLALFYAALFLMAAWRNLESKDGPSTVAPPDAPPVRPIMAACADACEAVPDEAPLGRPTPSACSADDEETQRSET